MNHRGVDLEDGQAKMSLDFALCRAFVCSSSLPASSPHFLGTFPAFQLSGLLWFSQQQQIALVTGMMTANTSLHGQQLVMPASTVRVLAIRTALVSYGLDITKCTSMVLNVPTLQPTMLGVLRVRIAMVNFAPADDSDNDSRPPSTSLAKPRQATTRAKRSRCEEHGPGISGQAPGSGSQDQVTRGHSRPEN